MHHPAHPTARLSFKLMVALLLVALGDWMFFQRGFAGTAFGLYAFALIGGVLAGLRPVRRDRRALMALIAAAVFAAAHSYQPSLLAWTLFWTALSLAILLPRTADFGDGWQWFQRLAWHALRSPFAVPIDLRRIARVRTRRPGRRGTRRPLAPLLALPVLGTLIFLLLFAAANPVLAQWLYAVRGPDLGLYQGRPILWLVLFALGWSMLRPRLALRLVPTFDGHGDLPLPGVSVGSVLLSLIAFNLVFALQNAMDIVYLWGEARLPGSMTMADYAHRGAYPLIGTALLAGVFVLVTLRPGSATAQVPAIRRLVLAWVAQNVFLVASSIERMIDYVGSYSLTELRIVVLGWMALVAFGLAAICWRMLAGKSAGWLINLNLAAATVLLTAASFADLGAIAARWNVRHAQETGGTAVNLDLCYLSSLGDSALLPLLELEQRPGLTPEFRQRVQVVRGDLYRNLASDLKDGSWTIRRAQIFQQAQRDLAAIDPLALTPGPRDCGGRLIEPEPEAEAPAPVAPPSAAGEPAAPLPALTEAPRK